MATLEFWADYICPWAYVARVRIDPLIKEYKNSVKLEIKALPLEWVNGVPTSRESLEAEWWVAAVHDRRAVFGLYRDNTFPNTAIPVFRAGKAALLQSYDKFLEFDLQVRRALFQDGMDISKVDVLLSIASRVGLDLDRFRKYMDSEESLEAVKQDYEQGREKLDPQGSPSFVLPNGKQLYNPAGASITWDGDRIVGLNPPPCIDSNCDEIYRLLFEISK